MATIKRLNQATTNEIIKQNNQRLKQNLIPSGYSKLETSKACDEAFENPINLPSYKVEKLINNQ